MFLRHPHCSFWLQYYPDHTKGLILMGDLNVNQLKNLDAAEQVRHVCVDVEVVLTRWPLLQQVCVGVEVVLTE